MFFHFLQRQHKALCSANFPGNLRGGGRNRRGVRVAINMGRERFFSFVVLHKHKPTPSETANELMTRGL